MSKEIPNSEIWRGGHSSETIRQEKIIISGSKAVENFVTISSDYPAFPGNIIEANRDDNRPKGICLSGTIPSKGGGFTSVYFYIPSESFDIVRKAMETALRPYEPFEFRKGALD